MAAGISGAAVSGLLAALAMAFPATVPVMSFLLVPLMVIGFSVLGLRLARLGKGWYEVYLSEQPLRPLALQYWLANQARATANYVGTLARRRLAEEAWEVKDGAFGRQGGDRNGGRSGLGRVCGRAVRGGGRPGGGRRRESANGRGDGRGKSGRPAAKPFRWWPTAATSRTASAWRRPPWSNSAGSTSS